MNYQHIMVREYKKDKHILALLLDSYDPQTDMLQYVDITTHQHSMGRYIQLRDRSTAHPITPNSPEEKYITELLAKDDIEPVFTDKFSNPNKHTQISKQ